MVIVEERSIPLLQLASSLPSPSLAPSGTSDFAHLAVAALPEMTFARLAVEKKLREVGKRFDGAQLAAVPKQPAAVA
jgi:hypothetical protein